MLRLQLTVAGTQKLLATFSRLSDVAKKEIAAEILKTCYSIEAEAKQNVSVKTGSLRNRIRTFVDAYGNAGVKAEAAHAMFVEKGTQPHVIRGNPVLSWMDKSSGSRLFAKLVHHPGTVAKPFLEPAFLKWSQIFIKRVDVIIQRAIDSGEGSLVNQ